MRKTSTLVVVTLILLLTASLFAEPKAYLGIFMRNMAESDYQKSQMDDNYGVLITKVTKDSPADEAGLKKNDIILKMAGDKVYTHDQVVKMMQLFKPEQHLKFKILRNSKPKDITVTLGDKVIPGMVKKAYMGVYLSELDKEKAEKISYTENYGICLDKVVEDGPSAEAGLKSGDIIMNMDKEKIYTQDQLTKMLSGYEPGKTVKIRVFRNNSSELYNVKLGERETFEPNSKLLENVFLYKFNEPKKHIGVVLKELNDQLKKSFNVKSGVMIEKVIPNAPADKAGLLAGDIIQKIDKIIMKNIKDIQKSIQEKEIDDKINIEIKRDKDNKNFKVMIGERKQSKNEEERFDVLFENGVIRIDSDNAETQMIDLNNIIRSTNTITIENDSLSSKEIFLDTDFDFDFEWNSDDSGEI